jgi:hypothetical protein
VEMNSKKRAESHHMLLACLLSIAAAMSLTKCVWDPPARYNLNFTSADYAALAQSNADAARTAPKPQVGGIVVFGGEVLLAGGIGGRHATTGGCGVGAQDRRAV